MMNSFRVGLGACALGTLALAGCGEDAAPKSNPASAGMAGSSVGQGGGGSGGAGGSAGMAQAGSGALDCNGAFAAPVLGMLEELDVRLGSPTFSPDGLELIYSREALDGSASPYGFRRSTRTNVDEPFPIGTPFTSLDVACPIDESRSIDLSADGLRAYIVCYFDNSSPVGPGTLRIAERPTLAGEFSLRPETLEVGPSGAISADELTLYTTSDVDIGGYPPRQFHRASASEMFGAGTDIPGFEAINLLTPDISPDGLSFYGALDRGIAVATRPNVDAPFGAPTTLYPSTDTREALGAPELSRDCRTLFYIKQLSVDTGTGINATLMMARR